MPAIEERADSSTFADLVRGLAASGISFRFQAQGRSMLPVIEDGQVLQIEPVGQNRLRPGDIVLFKKDGEFKAHRILRNEGGLFATRGDAGMHIDVEVAHEQIIGRVVAKECARTGRRASLSGYVARMRFHLAEMRRRFPLRALLILSGSLFCGLSAHAQIAVSGTATGTAQVSGSGAGLTFLTIPGYVVPVGTNRDMIVGISINTTANSPTSVTSVTFGAQSLTKIAGASTEVASMRVEMWQLLGPTPGTATITVKGTKSGGVGNKLGVVAGVVTLTGVDQTSPIRSSITASGSSATASVSPASAGGDFVLDTLAVSGGVTVTTQSIGPGTLSRDG